MKLLKTLLVLSSIVMAPAFAQDFPSRPIKFVVPFPAGGGADFHGRLVAQKVSEILKQPVVIENRGGANGNIGYTHVAKSAPDGYTILLGGANLTMAPFIYAKLAYDVRTDLAPITQLTRMPNVFTVRSNHPANSMQELLDAARKNPGKLNYASSGLGGGPHLTMEWLKSLTQTYVTHVPYQGDQAAFLALMAGDVDVYSASIGGALPLISGNKIRALAVSSKTRSPALPQVPTITEAGIKDLDFDSWYGVFAPGQTPTTVITILNNAIVQAMKDPDVRKKLLATGSEAVTSTPEELRGLINSDLNKYGRLIKAANIQPQ